MKEVCILIPTHNRANYMAEWLKRIAPLLNFYAIEVYIFDSSDNDDTEKICNNLNLSFIHYEHYTSFDSTPDLKVKDAFQFLLGKYNYIWLCGDGIILKIDDDFDKIKFAVENKFDLIHFCNNDLNINKVDLSQEGKIYSDCIEFARDFIHSFTLYGSTLLSNSILKRLIEDIDFEKFHLSGFYPQLAILSILSEGDKIIAFVGEFYETSEAKKVSGNGSYKPNSFFPIWVASWKRTIDLLPEKYDSIKYELYRNESRVIFSIKGLIRLRLSGNLSFKIIKDYWNDLKFVAHCSRLRFILVSCLPKFFCKLITKIYKKIKK